MILLQVDVLYSYADYMKLTNPTGTIQREGVSMAIQSEMLR